LANEEARFWAKVRKTSTHWLWLGTKNNGGYGRFWAGGHMVLAHRWAYEHWVGSIPDGLELDHLCRRPACVRPLHLEAVTHRINNLRGDSSHRRKTHCPAGHSYSGDNLYTYPSGWRGCRMCVNEASRRYRRRKRAAIAA
jgi:hypothetical protein